MKQIGVHPPKTGSKIKQHQLNKIAKQAPSINLRTESFFERERSSAFRPWCDSRESGWISVARNLELSNWMDGIFSKSRKYSQTTLKKYYCVQKAAEVIAKRVSKNVFNNRRQDQNQVHGSRFVMDTTCKTGLKAHSINY